MKKTQAKLNFYTTLLLFALLPITTGCIALSLFASIRTNVEMNNLADNSIDLMTELSDNSTELLNTLADETINEMTESITNGMVQVITEIGKGTDYSIDNSVSTIKAFATSPIISEYLTHPDDKTLATKAQQYTKDYFAGLEGWEGIYLADWNSKVLTHPADPVVGRVMREGDRLEELRNAMLTAEDGIYNTGIIISPASGELIMSFYYPIYDGKTPIGYIGAGTFISNAAARFSDVSFFDIEGAYTYFVAKDGTMVYHPNEEKIGQPVENAAVKSLIEQIERGESPEPGCVKYEYNGAQKYASFYIGEGDAYIAVFTADETNVLSAANEIKNIAANEVANVAELSSIEAQTIKANSLKEIKSMILIFVVITIVLEVIFAVIAFLVAKVIVNPLKKITKETQKISTGDTNIDTNIVTHITETVDIREALELLKNSLKDSIASVKNAADTITEAVSDVDSKTSTNVDSINQINDAIEEVAQTSQSVAENAQSMADKAITLGDNIDALTSNIKNLKSASEDIAKANAEASDYMKTVMDSSTESVEAVETISKKIGATNDAVKNITECVQMIEDISSQTNLLSLNASIEAARAGEAGRGFAVVAEEIRKLSDSTSESAKEIKDIVANVTTLSNETVAVANKVAEIISKEQQFIADTQDKFGLLSSSVNSSIDEIAQISEMTESLVSIKEQLTSATSELGAISQELGASAEEVSASSHTVAEGCSDTMARTEEMRSINDQLNEAVSFFKL